MGGDVGGGDGGSCGGDCDLVAPAFTNMALTLCFFFYRIR